MLRAVRFKNFIKFQDDQFFEFKKDGVYLFVGENNSGKSSVLEAIRRCMDIKSNCSFLMNVPNKAEPTYAICDFSLPADRREKFEGHNRIVTSFVRIPDKHRAHISAKVVLITDEGDTQKGDVYVDIIFTGELESSAKNDLCPITNEEKCKLFSELKILPKERESNPEQFLSIVSQVLRRYIENASASENTIRQIGKFVGNAFFKILSVLIGSDSCIKVENTKTESFLSALSEHVAFTFALRALGGVQWSKSSNLRKRYANYTAASERCEIIKWFSEKRFETSKADEIFTTLTGEGTFKFYFDKKPDGKDLLMIEDGKGDNISILKCPEGILEAKHISLMLSYEPFRTLLLEEPDRGMHPQMIHRLRSIVLAAQRNKTIIIVSHSASFISPMLIPRTFKFCKVSQTNGSYQFQIANIGDIEMSKMPGIANENYATVLFAKRILFVEGMSDLIFIRALIAYILNPETEGVTGPVFDLVSKLHKKETNADLGANWIKTLKHLLTSLDVLHMEGHGNKDKWYRFCKRTMTSNMFLLDADVVTKADRGQETIPSNFKNVADDIHSNVAELLKQKVKIDDKFAKNIANIIRKKFLENNLSIDYCENFTDQESEETIRSVKERIGPDHQNVDLDRLFESIDHRIYGKACSEEIVNCVISLPIACKRKINKTFKDKSTIVTSEVMKNFETFLENDKWKEARNELQKGNVFVWKEGSLEDAILDIILATKADNVKSQKDEIFRKYLAFYSSKINLLPESFRQKHQTKLYLERSDISYKDIECSIKHVFQFCSENSDIVHFLHFLTTYTIEKSSCGTEV